MRAAPPVDDVGVLITLGDFAFGEDDACFVGVAVDEDVAEADEDVAEADEEAEEAEEEAADTGACVAVWLAQLGCEVAETVFFGDVVELGLLGLLDDGVPVVVGLGLLDDGVPVVVGLELVLLLAPALGGAVLLLWLEPDEVAGAGVVWVDLLGEPVVLRVAGGCAEDEAQPVGLAAAYVVEPPGELPPGVGVGDLLAPAALPPGGELLLLKAWPMALPTCTIAWRVGGTVARTTPMANTATPTAKAGRSIASRQSIGRCGRCGARFGPPWAPAAPWAPLDRCGRSPSWTGITRRNRSPRRRKMPITKPEMASQTPTAPAGRLARAGRDRIFSRIRSRPSAPGST